ncbi:MAG: ribosomal protein S18-alanine N-acetyltransferase [Alphaproteobacteria bacterium]|nr:ribosomal protein S18-alanine N-acetyltransferase [Alphaproteobacteria bacterium]MBT4017699.1 ribosomal protein S18-alanine N-acetyltransferase [Alphaproteobacteria bacterium]MBT5160905.1 ribosomal protein S18-alanine N-acetyltransferase [Alphaproteobacteria bacterium]MBT5919315.1 ribosomal protein S18-alanine N-acetyltransferase [Alphaproteobacteria bacterium]MBT6387925.1 ribosomal protein S18-alanine N-acetyltransferase [Alphaproteobacteria bacterium]
MTGKGLIWIEPATIACADLLATLHPQIFVSDEQVWTSDSFKQLLAMPGTRAWLAITSRDGQEVPAGFALARFAADEAEIITIGVLPQCHRQGVGQLLLTQILDQTGEAGAEIFLEVAANNKAALKLYLKHGFAEAGRRKNYYKRGNGDRVDAMILRRPASTL